jgi:hypothetical protein
VLLLACLEECAVDGVSVGSGGETVAGEGLVDGGGFVDVGVGDVVVAEDFAVAVAAAVVVVERLLLLLHLDHLQRLLVGGPNHFSDSV